MNGEYPPSIRKIVARIDAGWPPTVDVNPGWYALLERLDGNLVEIAPNYRVQQKLGLSRQTVARTRDAHGIPSRPGRQPRFHVDIEWLREQYETERRTATSIARELGCSPTTIRRHLRAAGLTHGAT